MTFNNKIILPALTSHQVLILWGVLVSAFIALGYGLVLVRTVLAADPQGVTIACANGSALRIDVLQKPGGKRLPAGEFLGSFPIAAGAQFALPGD